MVLNQFDIYMGKKMNSDSYFILFINIYLSGVIDLNVKGEAMKFLDKNDSLY